MRFVGRRKDAAVVFDFEGGAVVLEEGDNVMIIELGKGAVEELAAVGDVLKDFFQGAVIGHVTATAACHGQFLAEFFIFF